MKDMKYEMCLQWHAAARVAAKIEGQNDTTI